MSTTPATNGKPQRKQWAAQRDRLDGIIAALSEGLNQAVADACGEGTRQAVRDVLIEIASNPELRELLVPRAVPAAPAVETPPEPKTPGVWSRLKAKVAEAKEAAADAVTRAKEAVIRRCAVAGEAVVALGRM